MYNHARKDYICPFCLVVGGVENEHVLTKQADIVYTDNYITAFISAGQYKNNKGNVIIIPNSHFENIYDLPDEISAMIHKLERKIAIALKEVYKCDGVSSRQHNEPCGNQDVWHYHLHVFPRYNDDNLYLTDRESSKPEERIEYANRLKIYFKNIDKDSL
ncbi:protein hit [Clostridium gelidum]|uniref:Protein hit n=1 Tax=Clostridium gelidum TaxID=704125 RepID=A0ABM7T681_9CLOT|nr:HIT family protein [Clostridium gelidum]BCZ46410.1 protein hit [Clostridium gelidum]